MSDNYTIIGRGQIGRSLGERLELLGIRHKFIARVPPDSTDILPTETTHVIVTAQAGEIMPTISEEMYEVNVHIVRLILADAVRKRIKRVAVFSTGSVYGQGHNQPISETALVAPDPALGSYSLSKLAMESIVMGMAGDFERCVIFRPFLMYGPNIRKPRLLARLPEIIRNGDVITLANGEGIIQSPIHTTDAALFVLESLKPNGYDILNIAGKEILSLREMASVVGEQLGSTPNFVETAGPSLYLCGDTTKASRFGFTYTIPFRDGIRDLPMV